MGYKRKNKTVTLKFEGHEDFEGLEVEMRKLSISAYLDIAKLAENVDEDSSSSDMRPLLKAFTNALVSWNLEDENDKPVPTTEKGVQGEDFDFIMTIVGEWMKAMGGVDDSLGKDSNSGETSLAQSIPMETS